jgi:hypothetical protein
VQIRGYVEVMLVSSATVFLCMTSHIHTSVFRGPLMSGSPASTSSRSSEPFEKIVLRRPRHKSGFLGDGMFDTALSEALRLITVTTLPRPLLIPDKSCPDDRFPFRIVCGVSRLDSVAENELES